MTKRIISMVLAFAMVLSILLSAVSCDELLGELLADPGENEAQSNIEDDIEETTKEEKTTKKEKPTKTAATEEEVTEEYTEDETTYVYETTYSGETAPVERPTRPAVTEIETEDETECGHCECAWIGCHYCEFCGMQLSSCADYDGDHKCDGCGTTLSTCADYNRDHMCDECGNILSACADKNSDHICDKCGMTLSECVNRNDDHTCDECGKVLSECTDRDGNGSCDVCGVFVGYPGLSTNGMHSPDTYRENGVVMKDGEADKWILNNRYNGITGVDTIGFRGWAFVGDGKTTGIVDFGYGFKQVEEITWGFEPIVDEYLFAPLENRTETRRYDITIDLTDLPTGEYDVILYVKASDGNIYIMDRWADVWVNHVNTYEQNSASSSASEDIDWGYVNQPLSESGFAFEVLTEGIGLAGGTAGIITEKNGVAVWQFNGGFSEYYATTTGKYYYNVDFYSGGPAAGAFVRGWKEGFTGWDPNYIGAVGNDNNYLHQNVAFGKAGIYYYVQEGSLVITVTSWNNGGKITDDDVTRVSILGCDGNITVVDLGNVIYFKSGESTVAIVELAGSANYGDITKPMCEYAKLTTWDGQIVEINNPLITADYAGIHIGLAQRVGTMDIKSVAYGSAKDVQYNTTLDIPMYIETDKKMYSEGEMIYVSASCSNNAYVVAYIAGTTDIADYYVMGKKDGFEGLTAGKYDIALVDYNDISTIYRMTTITVNPEGFVSGYDAENLAKRDNKVFGSTFGTKVALSNDKTYVTLTTDRVCMSNGDYNWYFAYPNVAGHEITASNYMVIKYRTNATNIDRNEILIQTSTIPLGASGLFQISEDKMIYDGEWHYLYINFEAYGVTDMDTCDVLRFDFLNGAPDGSTIDIEFINFYSSRTAAQDAMN